MPEPKIILNKKLQHFGARGAGCFRDTDFSFKLPKFGIVELSAAGMCQSYPRVVSLQHIGIEKWDGSDNNTVRQVSAYRDAMKMDGVPWALQLSAISLEDPNRLVQTLTGAILGCGGWVLSRGANDSGAVNLLFEFERRACIEIYSMLIATGIEFSQSGHIRFTELCQCTHLHPNDCGAEIASIDLEIQTLPIETQSVSQVTRPA